MELLEPGDSLVDRYVIEAEIGEGGFARVWRALDVSLNRQVAVKVLKSNDVVQTRRFLREVEVVSTLSHPNTVTLFDFGETPGGHLFMVSEYVEGEDLRDLLVHRSVLSEPEIVHILLQVAGSLQEAHATGLLHRDLKPENIRVFEYAGDPLCVKVLDFGIAKRLQVDPRLTGTGKVIGTPRYMSPEQLTGEELTGASDIYALGLVTYDMVLGLSAGMNRAMAGIGGVVVDESAPISEGLRALINQMLDDEPDNRPSAQDLFVNLRALRRQARPRPAPSNPVRRSSVRDAPDVGRRPPVTMLALLALAAVCVVGLFGIWAASEPERTVVVVKPPTNVSSLLAADEREPRVEIVDVPSVDVGLDVSGEISGCDGVIRSGDGLVPVTEFAIGNEFAYWLPKDYDGFEPLPVVLIFHAWAQSAVRAIRSADLARLSDKHNFIVVAPRDRTMPVPWRDDTTDRVGLVLSRMEQLACIDRSQVYAIGAGAGGRAAESTACGLDIAAFATVNYRSDGPPCDKMPPAIHFSGKSDPANPLEGGSGCTLRTLPSLKEHERRYKAAYGCTGEPIETLRDGEHSCYTWECRTTFESCLLAGGGAFRNAARGENALCPQLSSEFPINERMVSFFGFE